jgi:hypothetical protein
MPGKAKFYRILQLQKPLLRETSSSQRSKLSESFTLLLIVFNSPTNKTYTILFTI